MKIVSVANRCFVYLVLLSVLLKVSSTTGIALKSSTIQNDKIEQMTAKEKFISHHFSPKDAAMSMNSIDFLEELVKIKDTVDEKYYDLYENGNVSDNNNNNNKDYDYDEKNKENLVSVVEYTGKLWFMNKRGVKFQESVKINNLSKCGKYSTVECMTKYKSKNKWVDCSRVICSFQESDNNQGLEMKVGSEILVTLPLFGVGGAIKKQISKTFQVATDSFFQQFEAININRKEL